MEDSKSNEQLNALKESLEKQIGNLATKEDISKLIAKQKPSGSPTKVEVLDLPMSIALLVLGAMIPLNIYAIYLIVMLFLD